MHPNAMICDGCRRCTYESEPVDNNSTKNANGYHICGNLGIAGSPGWKMSYKIPITVIIMKTIELND